ncbi:hypothetical protein COTS27_01067 [Spirochaetota bacterium]|nr:hypothetical protein COTS27_01067 [Spirochaetota bacterium]
MKNLSGRQLASAKKKVTPPSSLSASIKRVEQAISAIKAGHGVVVLDSQSRENEGDLIIPAAAITDNQVNFMMKFCRGLICVALTQKKLDELAIPLMYERSVPSSTSTRTYFTVSVDHKDSTTGISASERAQTLRALAAKTSTAADFILPGHIFPIRAAPSILIRNGHTEAGIYLTTLADLPPAAVICEIINDDGTMARQTDLIQFTTTHGLKFLSIQDLILYQLFFSGLLSASQSLTIDIAINKQKASSPASSSSASSLNHVPSKSNPKNTSTQAQQNPVSCPLNITVYRNSPLTEQSRHELCPQLVVLECGLDKKYSSQSERILHKRNDLADTPNFEHGLPPFNSTSTSQYKRAAIHWIDDSSLMANVIEILLSHDGSREVTARTPSSMPDDPGRYFILGLFSHKSITTFFEILDLSLDSPLSANDHLADAHSQSVEAKQFSLPKDRNNSKIKDISTNASTNISINASIKKTTKDPFLAAATELKAVLWKDSQAYYPGDTLASLLMGIFYTRDVYSIVPSAVSTLLCRSANDLRRSSQDKNVPSYTSQAGNEPSANREWTLQMPPSLLKGLKRSGMKVQL